MVNTFLPVPDFKETAQLLDYKRLGKQRVETWQILTALTTNTKGWRNHPATLMWEGYEPALIKYGIAICKEWIKRGYNDTMLPRFQELDNWNNPDMAWWLGNKNFHKSHQSNLKRKDPIYYQFNVPDDLPYLWANNENKTWRTI